ncbi:MAG: hypothetical protein B0D96_12465 [Candidatus Sedimenticola endophacoides]|uniref:AMP-dependent synthetase/ligase domain-containing protein n=1 Tax=Candidatus Sedimenticola endophacoides TaxID=2548426 RepID=A0A657PLF4_9GAMM|nr:MAG: hypothetical protein B0D94_00875 [Candidatus Sedimenticola endophacoides]OQX32503.1 MAG: hypothetical protein B0D84_06100 [Candidatus Sedimenticola endophacoides]OQX32985.1 MAG: hypothetical protein B0D96_12465 [Candidatus Sedimenticola endophacoides]OQX38525.1 MAG: hypothetical protein B0D89_12580 [Candidatus Sedimenticola endophacoides]PUD98816.1 MAG: hypothetical protein C3L26_11230 [Candidatus Sedimenticola endophacoides]
MITVYPRDRTLSFLPLSHMLERTAGYYLMLLAGASVAFARSIPLLGEDLRDIRPSILISVPRIFERVYGRIMEQVESAPAPRRWLFEQATRIGWKSFEHHQGRRPWSPDLLFKPLLDALVGGRVRARLGGRLRFAISGGAALSASIARTFIALGVPIQQGYGLTEFAPIISVNRLEDNLPASVGTPLPGVEVRVDEHQELLVRGCSLMQGYWNDPGGTAQALDPQGWLHTGDQVLLEEGHLYITGRLKEIIVLANGEKVAPADMEGAIALDGLFEQVLVVGEGRSHLCALLVLDPQAAESFRQACEAAGQESPADVEAALRERVNGLLHAFPGYARIDRVAVVDEPWSIDNGLLTPTLKLRRERVTDRHQALIDSLYAPHPSHERGGIADCGA